jgi:hypothetical protein
MEEARVLSTYVSYVEVDGEARSYNRLGMNAPRGGRAANHVIEIDALT